VTDQRDRYAAARGRVEGLAQCGPWSYVMSPSVGYRCQHGVHVREDWAQGVDGARLPNGWPPEDDHLREYIALGHRVGEVVAEDAEDPAAT